MNAIRTWFDSMAPRERVLVGSAAVLTLVAIVVIGLLRPLAASRAIAAEAVESKRAVLADIERVAARFGPNAPAGTAAPTTESLVVLIDRSTRARGLGTYLRRNEPDGEASIRLRFENAPFDELVAWLGELQASHAIGVMAASADAAQDAGRVNANLQLSRTAGTTR